MGLIAFVFPGQGSQKVGMVKELVDSFSTAKRTFDEADDALGYSISRLCFEGPEEELQLTANAQPAILTASIAALRVLREETGLNPDMVAGHSLGEYSALVCAEAVSFADAVGVVHHRGRFMQEAVPAGEGAMAAVIGMPADAVEELCQEAAKGQVVRPANFNGGGQIVVAGHSDAVARVAVLAEDRDATVRPLKVSAPFHCPLMEPAAARLRNEIAKVNFTDPKVPVVTNVQAEPNESGAETQDLLFRQVTAPVRWEESVKKMADMGASVIFEVGCGTALVSMIRRIDERFVRRKMGDLTAIGDLHQLAAIETPADIDGVKRRVFHDLEKHVAALGDWRIANDGSKISRDQSRIIWADNSKEPVNAERWHLPDHGPKLRKWGPLHVIWPDGRLEGLGEDWTRRMDGAFVRTDHSRIITPSGELRELDLAEWDVSDDGTMKKTDGTHIIWTDGLEWDFYDENAHGF